MNWTDISEVVTGLVLLGRLSPHAIDLSKVQAPYSDVIELARKGVDTNDIRMSVGWQPITASLQACESVKDDENPGQYISMLEVTASQHEAGTKLATYSKKLMRGESVDVNQLRYMLDLLDAGRTEFVTLDKVKEENDMWRPTYYPPIDEYFGGQNTWGLGIIGAPPATGKTSLVIRLINNAVCNGKTVGFFSLEMTLELIRARIRQVNPNITDEQMSRIVASDAMYDAEKLYAAIGKMIAQYPDIHAIYIDFADMMIPVGSEESTPMASKTYLLMAIAAKMNRVCIWLLSQLNDRYVGGIPKVNHIRYTRLAEAYASHILLILNPDQIYVDQGEGRKSALPYVQGKAYIIQGKSKYGYKMGKIGAVQVDFDGLHGWGEKKGNWLPLGGV